MYLQYSIFRSYNLTVRLFKAAKLQFIRGKEKHCKYVFVTENTFEQCQVHLRLSSIRPFLHLHSDNQSIFLSQRQKANFGKKETI